MPGLKLSTYELGDGVVIQPTILILSENISCRCLWVWMPWFVPVVHAPVATHSSIVTGIYSLPVWKLLALAVHLGGQPRATCSSSLRIRAVKWWHFICGTGSLVMKPVTVCELWVAVPVFQWSCSWWPSKVLPLIKFILIGLGHITCSANF